MPKVNPEILQWARETAGLTLSEAAKKIGLREARGESPESRLTSLESGTTEPSRPLLLKMAKQYRRPLLVFYMKEPPRKGDRGQDFRTLPGTYPAFINGQIDALIRDVKARQGILRSVIEDDEDDINLSFVGSITTEVDTSSVVTLLKKEMDFNNVEDFYDRNDATDAFNFLRAIVEKTGVFVLLIGDLGSYHTAFSVDVFRGFTVSDKIAPFIIINDNDSKAAWSFTLIHELVHLWLGYSGISGSYSENRIEKYCNSIASEFLLPKEVLSSFTLENQEEYKSLRDNISDFAYSRNLSSSMVAYRLYLTSRIDRETWMQLNSDYKNFWLDYRRSEKEKRRGSEGGGPTYYVVRRHRLGENLISQVQQMIYGGDLTTTKASTVLGVAPKNVQNLFQEHSSVNS